MMDIVYVETTPPNTPTRTQAHKQQNTDASALSSLSLSLSLAAARSTNSFCAGGISLGDGRWINAGGNQAIGSGGVALNSEDQNVTDVYDDGDGGTALRVMTPCDDGSCEWSDDESNWMNSRRWYPELETLPEVCLCVWSLPAPMTSADLFSSSSSFRAMPSSLVVRWRS